MHRLSIRWRLTLWYAGVLSVVLICFSAAVLVMMRQNLRERTDAELDEELDELALEVRMAATHDEMLEHMRQRFYHHETYQLQVSAPDGRPLFRSARLTSEQLAVPPFAHDMPPVCNNQTIPGLGRFRVKSHIATGPAGPLIVQAAVPLAPNDRELAALTRLLFTIGPLAILGTLGGGYLLARQALAPVDCMARTAEKITAEQLHQRLETPHPDDELGHLASTLNRMLDRLRHCIDETRRFTADAAHELRTPLAVLRTEMEVCLRSPRSEEEYRQAIRVMLQETNDLSHLAEQLLLLCRQECGLADTLTDEVQLDAVVHDVIEHIHSLAETKGLTVDVQPLPSWIIPGEDVRLSQLFFNLLDNAIKYTPVGGRITVTGYTADGAAHLLIADTGVGIAAEHLPHVFERFYRAEPSRSRETGGMGLGLAISRSIVTAHRGQIAIESTPGRGTRVEVGLPLLRSPTDPAPTHVKSRTAPALTYAGN